MAGARGSKVKVQQGHHICVSPLSVYCYSKGIYYTENECILDQERIRTGGLSKSV